MTDPENIIKQGDTTFPALVAHSTAPSGRCPITKSVDGPFIASGIQYENRGVYEQLDIDANWIAQVARDLLGMVEPKEIQDIVDERDEAAEELAALRLAFDALTNAKQEVPA